MNVNDALKSAALNTEQAQTQTRNNAATGTAAVPAPPLSVMTQLPPVPSLTFTVPLGTPAPGATAATNTLTG